MSNIAIEFQTAVNAVQHNLHFTLGCILVLWVIHIVNWVLGYRLNYLGIYPRNIFGLIGIPCSPFLHGNFNHLFFNSIPLFVLLNFVLMQGYQTFYDVTLFIIIVSGSLVWLFGRKAIHVGASSLIMGYWGYLLVNAFHQSTFMSIVLGVVCIYYFGGLLFELIPTRFDKSSWEGHIFGFIAGVSANYLLPDLLSRLPF